MEGLVGSAAQYSNMAMCDQTCCPIGSSSFFLHSTERLHCLFGFARWRQRECTTEGGLLVDELVRGVVPGLATEQHGEALVRAVVTCNLSIVNTKRHSIRTLNCSPGTKVTVSASGALAQNV
jgi:hypothetical protein